MTTQHTPGPWRLPSGPNATIHGYDMSDICNVRRNTRFEANARLIAAAPDLLDALELVAGFDWRNNRTHLLEIVTATIAKARGQK